MTKFKRQKKSYEDLPTLELKRGIDNNNLEVDETKDQMQSYEEYRLLALDLLKKQQYNLLSQSIQFIITIDTIFVLRISDLFRKTNDF